jgi:hypothetical protein
MATEKATTQTLAGQAQRRRRQERRHHVHADDDQPAIDQAQLPQPFLFLPCAALVFLHGHHPLDRDVGECRTVAAWDSTIGLLTSCRPCVRTLGSPPSPDTGVGGCSQKTAERVDENCQRLMAVRGAYQCSMMIP